MLPTMPAGQTGAPRTPRRIGAGGTPSSARARRAQCRTVVNSCLLFATALASNASSAGNRAAAGGSVRAYADRTPAGRIFSSTGEKPQDRGVDRFGLLQVAVVAGTGDLRVPASGDRRGQFTAAGSGGDQVVGERQHQGGHADSPVRRTPVDGEHHLEVSPLPRVGPVRR